MPQESGAINPEDRVEDVFGKGGGRRSPSPQEQAVRRVVGLLPVVVSHLREE